MNIAILGTGTVGQTIGKKMIDLGHRIMIGSRTADNEKAKAFVAEHPDKAGNGTFSTAAAFGELIFNCTSGGASLTALQLAGSANLNGKVLIDVSNPLDFSNGAPPSLSICNTASLGETIQETFPDVKVVKSLNTMWCGLMVNPQLIHNGDHNVFLSGNDESAKQTVRSLLVEMGWTTENIIDLGDITTARGPEMYLPLWLRIWGATKNGAFNIKIVS